MTSQMLEGRQLSALGQMPAPELDGVVVAQMGVEPIMTAPLGRTVWGLGFRGLGFRARNCSYLQSRSDPFKMGQTIILGNDLMFVGYGDLLRFPN